MWIVVGVAIFLLALELGRAIRCTFERDDDDLDA